MHGFVIIFKISISVSPNLTPGPPTGLLPLFVLQRTQVVKHYQSVKTSRVF